MNNYKMFPILIALFQIALELSAQNAVKVFNTFIDYTNQNPKTCSSVIVERRTQGDIFMSGGNDYKIYSIDKTLSKDIKKVFWGIECNDSLFVNCFHHKLGFWYAYAEKIGERLFLKASITLDKEQQQKMAMTSYALGPIGGGISAGKLAQLRYYYNIDLTTGEITYLSKKKMLEFIAKFPILVEQYDLEPKPEDINILRKYLEEYKTLSNE